MMATGPGTAHRHKTAAGNWYDWTDAKSGSPHSHELPTHPADALTEADVAKLLLVLAGSGGGTTPVDTTAPVISGLVVSSVTATGAVVSWSLSEPATGQVEYGLTTGYGTSTTLAGPLTNHSQTISGLTANTTYHFRVHSTDAASNAAMSADEVFTTLTSPAPPPDPPPAPPPAATPPVYGAGFSGDSRNNHRIGDGARAKQSYRFVASTTSTLTGFRLSERGLGGGNTYSGGTGGTIRAQLQTNSGGLPSGIVLATVSWNPGNPAGHWEVWPLHTFSSPPSLTAGSIYHLVLENTDPDPVTNYISTNVLFTFNGMHVSPRFPHWSDDNAILYAEPTTWVLQTNEAGTFDLIYANGVHDGQAYIGELGGSGYYGSVSGTLNQVRQTMTVSGGSRTVTTANVKVKRIVGTSPLIVTLETGAGSLIEAVSIPAADVAIGLYPNGGDDAAHLGGNSWAKATFLSSHVLTNGSSYNLRLSCAAGTEYVLDPLQDGISKGLLSFTFRDGRRTVVVGGVTYHAGAEKSTDGGASWATLYPYIDNGPTDLQFFFEVV